MTIRHEECYTVEVEEGANNNKEQTFKDERNKKPNQTFTPGKEQKMGEAVTFTFIIEHHFLLQFPMLKSYYHNLAAIVRHYQ